MSVEQGQKKPQILVIDDEFSRLGETRSLFGDRANITPESASYIRPKDNIGRRVYDKKAPVLKDRLVTSYQRLYQEIFGTRTFFDRWNQEEPEKINQLERISIVLIDQRLTELDEDTLSQLKDIIKYIRKICPQALIFTLTVGDKSVFEADADGSLIRAELQEALTDLPQNEPLAATLLRKAKLDKTKIARIVDQVNKQFQGSVNFSDQQTYEVEVTAEVARRLFVKNTDAATWENMLVAIRQAFLAHWQTLDPQLLEEPGKSIEPLFWQKFKEVRGDLKIDLIHALLMEAPNFVEHENATLSKRCVHTIARNFDFLQVG